MNQPSIPKKTAEKMASSFPKGTRHQAKLDIALPLLGSGMSPSAVFAQLRAQFPEASESEIDGVIRWCDEHAEPPTKGNGATYHRPNISYAPPPPKPKPPAEHAAWWTNGATMTLDEFLAKSQMEIPEDRVQAASRCFEMLYQGTDCLNIVAKFTMGQDGKARPDGAGKILTRDFWLDYFAIDGLPESKAGAWFRPNPVAQAGSGSGGAVTDSDVTAFRYLLVESDVLPLATQFALYSRLKMPISAVLLSGGISAHAWVRLDCKTSDEYDTKARRILTALAPFGFDQANKNPSRLSRLPGARRVIGAAGDGMQRLLWLNPGKPPMTDTDIIALEESLLCPAIEEKPFRKLLVSAIARYEELYANKGNLGVPTGFHKFDSVSGGLKPGGYTLIAAGTGVGKTTVAMNIINSALKHGVGVVLFTLEMSADDVTDMMFSMNCGVNRNHFNTGEFQDGEIAAMTNALPTLSNLNLFLEDDPDASMAMIRRRTLSLTAEDRIGLAVIDYAQLVNAEMPTNKREECVASVALDLRRLSRQSNIPIVVLSQLNDEGRLRESRRLGHEAANVLLLNRDNLTTPTITMVVAKGRKIPSTPIELRLDAIHCRITDCPIHPSDVPATTPPHPND